MAIVKMKKFTLLAFESQNKKLFTGSAKVRKRSISEVLVEEGLEEYFKKRFQSS